jgi:hypothetical protein
MIERRGLARGVAVASLDDDDAVQLTLPFDRRRWRARRRSTTRAVRISRADARRAARRRRVAVPMLPD